MLLAESQTSELNPISEIMLNLYLISPPPPLFLPLTPQFLCETLLLNA